jgi:hypothetical protein
VATRPGQDALEELNISTRLKPRSAYENIRICYTIIVVKLLDISVTFCGHLKEGFLLEGYIKKTKTNKPIII